MKIRVDKDSNAGDKYVSMDDMIALMKDDLLDCDKCVSMDMIAAALMKDDWLDCLKVDKIGYVIGRIDLLKHYIKELERLRDE